MYLVAGLGNPTKKYEKTRHNMGYDCIDRLAVRFKIKLKRSRFAAMVGKGKIGGEQVLLVKPLTYMNLSGNAIAPLAKYYKINTVRNMMIIYDDTDMEPGKLRIRKKGSAGGHNGMKSIISNIGNEIFLRIRIGIGKCPEYMEMADYVLGHFSPSERKLVDEAIERATQAVVDVIEQGAEYAMNKYNRNGEEC
ncbi:MAG: aminoacyl-tRNA hydrolase [Lachnospiraceae bacterium]|jgi:PTH1 family peptidyl-tRNA hydrolase